MDIIFNNIRNMYLNSNEHCPNIIDLLEQSGMNLLELYYLCKYKKDAHEDVHYVLRNPYLDINLQNLLFLTDACRSEDLKAVKIILDERDGKVNPRPEGFCAYSYLRPLGIAMNRNSIKIVKYLLSRGVYVTEADMYHGSTLVGILDYVKNYVKNYNLNVIKTGPGDIIDIRDYPIKFE